MPEIIAKYQPSSLNGYVEFKIPNISHPSFGKATISGRFPRIQPRFSRPEVDPKIISGLTTKFAELVAECGIGTDSFERVDVPTTIAGAIQFTLYWNPTITWDSKGFTFYVWFLIFGYFFDDALEDGWFAGRLNVKTVQYVHETYDKIIRMQAVEEELPGFEELPAFHGICKVLRRMVAAGVDFVGDDYVEYIEPFASAFQACFLNDDWFTCCRVDKRFSLGTYRAWRQGNAGCDVCLECQMFVCGIRVSQNVRRHPVFKRIITIALTNVAWVNDIFGAGKDFSSAGNHPDNEIVFRVVEKGESIQDVVDNMCLLIEEELHDLIYMKQTLVDIFGEDESIRCFLEMVDVQIDGQLMVYMENTRYKCNRGYVRIFRDADEKGKIETVPSG